MKIQLALKQTGNILIGAVVAMAVMGLVLLSYLSMVGTQTKITARSQAWNTCIALAESGVEEALAHLNKNGVSASGSISLSTDLAVQGWVLNNGTYYLRRAVDDGYFETRILNGARPLITSTGYMPAPINAASLPGPIFAASQVTYPWNSGRTFISRTVEVTVRSIGKFNKAIVARDKVELNGKGVDVDSYHSYDPNGRTHTNGGMWGIYTAAKRRANGDIAVIEGFSDDLNVNNAKVYGKVATGPDGDLKVKKNAAVGSLAWHSGGNLGVEPGWSTSDANFDMPSVVKPFDNSTGLGPIAGLVDGEWYDAIYYDGDYKVSELKNKIYIAGNTRILVTSKIDFKTGASEDDGIDIADTGRLEIYMEGKEAKMVGKKHKKKSPTTLENGINPDGNTTNFFYFGLNKHEKLELHKMDKFSGIIYAPNAEIILKAGSIKDYRCEVHGSIQGKKVKLEKNAHLHYDENIGSLPADSFVVESWKEI